MFDLITATQALKMLKEKDDITYSKSYFSQMVAEGKIPFHHKPNSPKKFFKYGEVKQAIEDSKDPTRDAQREANNKNKEKPQEASLMDMAGSYPSEADLTEEEKAELAKDKKEAEEARLDALDAADDSGEPDDWESSVPENTTQAGAKAEKEYWLGRKAELEVKKMTKELISVADAKAAIEFIMSPINRKLDEIPQELRANFSDITEQHYTWLVNHVNSIKKELTVSNEDLL